MYNRVTLMGRITKDLELKTTLAGVSVLSFSIAVDRAYQEKGKDKVSDFFNIVAWRGTAEFISRFFVKGSMILVEGELQNRCYKDKNGVDKWVTEIIADKACFTGEKKTSEQSTAPEQSTEPKEEMHTELTHPDEYPF